MNINSKAFRSLPINIQARLVTEGMRQKNPEAMRKSREVVERNLAAIAKYRPWMLSGNR